MEEKNKKDKDNDNDRKEFIEILGEILGGNAQKALEIVNNYKNKESRDEGEDK